MSGRQDLKFEHELRQLADDVARDGLPFRIVPRRRWRWRVAIRDELRNEQRASRAANAAALAIRVFDPRCARSPPASSGAELACKAGCTYCCHNVVMATAPEIFLAASELRARHDAQFIAEVAGRCDAVATTAGRQKKPLPAAPRQSLLRLCGAAQRLPQAHLASPSMPASPTTRAGAATSRSAASTRRSSSAARWRCCVGMRLWDGRPGTVLELSGALRVVLEDPQAEQRWLAGEAVFAGVQGQSKLPGIDEHAAFLWGRFVGPLTLQPATLGAPHWSIRG